MPRRLSQSATAVLHAIAGGVRYGFDLIDATGLPSGTVYPTLARLEHAGLVASRWEDAARAQAEKRPPRRYYELRPAGADALKDALRALKTLQKPIRVRTRAARHRG